MYLDFFHHNAGKMAQFIDPSSLWLQAVELKVEMLCFHSERKLRKCLSKLKGVRSVEVELRKKKVIVRGEAEESKVIRTLRRSGFRCTPWRDMTELLLNAYTQRYQKGFLFVSNGVFWP
ncbi:hypothetical protein J5N97_018785 [Dioscorea zingiberensis]|uniref:HMA domain-containing protein n=1 Tax=Dioscorea zingiberensis TaxID=325984 RepID=A0A9D5CCY1_9LILI|nr:hypothetical protein J5N97_018785 [Dioscorea zingiberensis]